MKRSLLLFLGCLLLAPFSGCKDITGVQTGYVSDRDQCRSNSENGVGVYNAPGSYAMSTKEKNTALLTLFCECMKQKEWKVAGCPNPKDTDTAKQAAPAGTTVVVVQAPPAAAAAETPEACPAPTAPAAVHKAYKKRHPATVCPTAPGTTFDDPDSTTLNNILGKDN